MKKGIVLLLMCISIFSSAQDDLLSMLGNDNEPVFAKYTFKGTKIVNGQSVELPAEGVLQFLIQHRFGALNSGAYNLYGLDNSQVRMGFEYGLQDWFMLGVGRSSALKIIDANAKVRFLRQVKGERNFPFTVVLNSSMYIKQYRSEEANLESFLFSNQLSYTSQLLVARKISRNLSLQFTPTLVHYNLVKKATESNDKLSLGIGGRQKLTKRMSLNAECFLQLNDKVNNNVMSLGLDIETGGHVFQFHLSNSPAMVEPAFINETTGSWENGDLYFGFNISRVFTLKKK